MSKHFDADVAVVGYGPTGLIAALTLAKEGASVIAFEHYESIYPRARAVTVNDWTMRIFQDLGIDSAAMTALEPQRALRWLTYDRQEVMRVEHPPSTLGASARFYNMYQPAMEATLRECGRAYDKLQVRYNTAVEKVEQDADGVTVTALDTVTGQRSTTRVRYVVGADGANSTVRQCLGIDMPGETMSTKWIVIDCYVKRWWPDRDWLTFWTDKKHPVVDIMLSARAHRWELPLAPDETEADYATKEQVWPLLKALGHDENDIEIHQYAFYQHPVRYAERWREGRVFLAGDACHLTHPWAGSGMQNGMRDGHNLGWKLGRVLAGKLDEAWLHTYEIERRPVVVHYTNLAVTLGHVIKQTATPEEMAEMSQPKPGLVTPWEPPLNAPPQMWAGWLRGPIEDASIIGRMVPQPMGCDTEAMGKLDDRIGNGFVLLGDAVNPADVLTAAEKKSWDDLGARYITVRSSDSFTITGADEIVDLGGAIQPWMRRYGAKVIALRPDKFVAAADVSGLAVPDFPTAMPTLNIKLS
ncbi:MAG: FAD-dependent monooxygenase [Burkholderiaceae bacterium]|jgi:3-(3-hydroxy-phenyl)propionate hydroxylase|nr:FAD-dependent monooxygenase [Burkholderiaceae bacterium]